MLFTLQNLAILTPLVICKCVLYIKKIYGLFTASYHTDTFISTGSKKERTLIRDMRRYGKRGEYLRLVMDQQVLRGMCSSKEFGHVHNPVEDRAVDGGVQDYGKLGVSSRQRKMTIQQQEDALAEH